MKYLLPGSESAERMDILLSLTKMSEKTCDALKEHLVLGYTEENAASLNGISQQNFNRAVNNINEVAEKIEKIKVLDYKHIKSVK